MNVLIILAHPDTESFNHAIADTCRERLLSKGHTVCYHDLYQEHFDPALTAGEMSRNASLDETIQDHCNDLVHCDGIIVVHPNWWAQPPAMLKGWIDRVIRPGIAYKFEEGDNGEGVPVGLLRAKVGIVFNTSNTSEIRETLLFKDPLETIWKNCVFDLCGVRVFDRKVFRIIVTSDSNQRQLWLSEVADVIDKYFPGC